MPNVRFVKYILYICDMPLVKTNKEEIVLEALSVFRSKGYYNTSMHDLALACGLQKGSFYHYFPSKEVLMFEVLELVRANLQTHVFTIADRKDMPAKERLEKMLLKLGKYLLQQSGGCIVGNTILETAGQNIIFKDTLKGIFTDWAAAMKKVFIGQYSESSAQRLAEQVIMEFEGAIMMSQIYENAQYPRDVFVRTLAKLK